MQLLSLPSSSLTQSDRTSATNDDKKSSGDIPNDILISTISSQFNQTSPSLLQHLPHPVQENGKPVDHHGLLLDSIEEEIKIGRFNVKNENEVIQLIRIMYNLNIDQENIEVIVIKTRIRHSTYNPRMYESIALFLLNRTTIRPEVGIICGSGLSGLSNSLEDKETFNYESIPGFPRATVPGHTGELVFGRLGGIDCVCMRGRFHYYEGNSMERVVLPVRVMRMLGVKLLIVTNAAGGLNPHYNVGDIVIIQDHFGMPGIAGNHPLRGENDDLLGPRFPSVSDSYDSELQKIVLDISELLGLNGIVRPNGTYCFVSGPAYESRAESRFLRLIGGDAVGMSTVPEVIAAKHCGMRVLGLSLITNKVVVEKEDNLHASHSEVLQAVLTSGKNVEQIVKLFISKERIGEYLSALDKPPLPRQTRSGFYKWLAVSVIVVNTIALTYAITRRR